MNLTIILAIFVATYLTKTVHLPNAGKDKKMMGTVKFFLFSYCGAYIAVYAAAFQMLNS